MGYDLVWTLEYNNIVLHVTKAVNYIIGAVAASSVFPLHYEFYSSI